MSEGVQVIVDERQLFADLEVLKSSESRNVVVSETFDYLLVVSNSGQDEATSVFVTDILPVELGFEKLDGPQLGSANYETETRTVIWKIRSEEHTSELQSLMRISYAVFCLKKKNRNY